ncbi:MAG: FAD:protein FMN transferase, partial [Thermoanaerobaculia bacterium]|nr:FAD:protein FMN transferase [Thermoanaerobaculia bacterium]
ASALLLTGADSAAAPQPVRISAEIGERRVAMEVRDLPHDEATLAIRRAIGTLAAVRRSLSPDDPQSRIAELNATAGRGPHATDPGTAAVLERALGFCVWSQGAQGPLGGTLYDLWEAAERPPGGPPLEAAAATAECSHLRPVDGRWSLDAGSRVDLRHFADGHAVDRAMEELRRAGAANASIEYGPVTRAIGEGPAGRGWKVTLPLFPGLVEPLEPIWLRDRALAIATTHRDRFRFGSSSYAAYLDQRDGRPAENVVAVLAASELAVDAQAFASTMVVLGNREGQFRLGTVDPAPAVMWLLGDGTGMPLVTTRHWSSLRR